MVNGVNNKSEMEVSVNPNRKYQIALVVVIIAIIVVGWIYWSGQPTGGMEVVSPSAHDSIEDEVIEDTVEVVDTIIVDSLPSVDSVVVDSVTQSISAEYEKIYDSSRREMKNELMRLERLITDTDREYSGDGISADSARVVSDSVLNVLTRDVTPKYAEMFKNQISNIERKANNLIKKIEETKK